jgi:hypothetical protein
MWPKTEMNQIQLLAARSVTVFYAFVCLHLKMCLTHHFIHISYTLFGAFCLVIDHMACNIRWPITLFISGVYNTMEATVKKKSKWWIFSSSSLKKNGVLHSTLQLKLKNPGHEEACGPSLCSYVTKY